MTTLLLWGALLVASLVVGGLPLWFWRKSKRVVFPKSMLDNIAGEK